MEKFLFISYCVLHGIAFLVISYIAIVLYRQKNKSKNESKNESKNKVHFYVAKDECGSLYLYLGKPERRGSCFISLCGNCYCAFMIGSHHFENFGLNPDDFENLKWEDEPIEVFLNLED